MVAHKGHFSVASFLANEIFLAIEAHGGVVKSIAELRDSLKLSDAEFENGLAWCLERQIINIDDEGSALVQ